ncbi:MAG TPA: glycoside hydrolase family 2 TIM barrel-domain containing protein, partial [Chthoniobacteraceae bacterium]|nr:glycoside hydrolase family 2 TIM barrel-domain containing protein [Chthoniobacteraceae bacterium]
PIHGVCDHHDLGCLGSAAYRSGIERQLEILKTIGVNAIRTSHNPPSPELLDLCDSMGFVVMDEAFDEWKANKTQFGYGRFFDDWSERDLQAMVRRDRNHPSVILWSIGNEIPEQGAPDGGAMAKRLADIVRREDPTRPVTSACNSPGSAVKTGFAAALDVLGINYNIGEYNHWKGRPLVASETASAISSRGVYNLLPAADGHLEIKAEYNHQMSSYDIEAPGWANKVETSLQALRDAPWVAGQFVWTGFDYIGEPTPFGWPSRSSYFGIFDLCGFPKDRAYLYQSQWTDKPVVHLFPHWNWEGFEGKETPVRCYTNADSVELFLNGKSLGVRDWKDNKTLHLEWSVPYAPGMLKAVGTKDGKPWAIDEIHTAGPPAKIALETDRKSILTNGEDLAFITIRIEDKDGNPCPNADNTVKLSIKGPGDIAGTDNGDATDLTSFQSPARKAFHGMALAVIKSLAVEPGGDIEFTATSEGLAPAKVKIGTPAYNKPDAGWLRH